MTRFAERHRVFFVEEPVHGDASRLEISQPRPGLLVLTPVVRRGSTDAESVRTQRALVHGYLSERGVRVPIVWFYTPMALPIAEGITPSVTVYDCMDELSLFANAPPILKTREEQLMALADVVFTGGHSLYLAKKHLHRNIHPFPSSVDFAHFASARYAQPEPQDQKNLPWPRIGFFGVLDERLDIEIVRHVAAERPRWQLLMIGPTAKIDPESLPRAENIHYLGIKAYKDLPAYLAGWDVAMMPFALNDATRFISPTKTLEYLAAGRPVISTAIRDVVHPYGEHGVVRIADKRSFVKAIENALEDDPIVLQDAADALLRETSWDRTFERMRALVDRVIEREEPEMESSCSIG